MNFFKPLAVVLLLALGLITYLFLAPPSRQDTPADPPAGADDQTLPRYRITAALLNGATLGIHGTTPEAQAAAERVVDFMLRTQNPPETAFKDCWDQRLANSERVSTEAHSLLEACISQIKAPETAQLLKDIEALKGALLVECSKEGNNRFEEALHCWADRSYRLVFSADKLLHEFVTDPGWLGQLQPTLRLE